MTDSLQSWFVVLFLRLSLWVTIDAQLFADWHLSPFSICVLLRKSWIDRQWCPQSRRCLALLLGFRIVPFWDCMFLWVLTIFRLFFWQGRSRWLAVLSIFGYVLPRPTWIDRWWRVICDKFLSIFHWECFDCGFLLRASAIIVSFRSLVS